MMNVTERTERTREIKMSDTDVIETVETEATVETVTEATDTQRRAPWLRLNRLVPDTEYDTVEDVLAAAELDFTVSLRDIRFAGIMEATDDFGGFQANPDDREWHDAPSRKAVVRDDTGEFFDVVSADYGVLQYGEAYEFLNHLEGRRFVAAGPLKDARQAFMVVKLPDLDDFTVAGTDLHELNVVVRTSHDRSRAVEVFTMPLRVTCVNQLPLRPITGGVLNRWSIHHIGNVTEKMHDADVLVDRVREYVADFKNTAERLVATQLGTEDASFVLRRVIRESPTKDDVIEHIISLWQNADTVGFHGTGWGLTNAVSDYFEHGRRGGTAQSRMLGALEGQTRGVLDRTVPLILGRFGK
jgi:phage/plasmid-like protein (TIGR03299 family)